MAETISTPDPKPKLEPVARDPELWQALGQLSVYYANLEEQLRFNIWTMLQKEPTTAPQDIDSQWVVRIVLAGQSFRSLIDVFCSLCKLRHADPRRLDLVRKDLERVSVGRNECVHSNWSWGDKPGAVSRYSHTARAKRGLNFKNEQITPADVRALADDIGFVTLRVAGIMHEVDLHPGLWDEAPEGAD